MLHNWDKDGGGTFNAGRHSNARLDALIDAVRIERDPDERRTLVATSLKLAGDDIAYVPLYRRILSWAMQKNVHVVMLPDDPIPVRRAVVQ